MHPLPGQAAGRRQCHHEQKRRIPGRPGGGAHCLVFLSDMAAQGAVPAQHDAGGGKGHACGGGGGSRQPRGLLAGMCSRVGHDVKRAIPRLPGSGERVRTPLQDDGDLRRGLRPRGVVVEHHRQSILRRRARRTVNRRRCGDRAGAPRCILGRLRLVGQAGKVIALARRVKESCSMTEVLAGETAGAHTACPMSWRIGCST